jgi:hypothetical protein
LRSAHRPIHGRDSWPATKGIRSCKTICWLPARLITLLCTPDTSPNKIGVRNRLARLDPAAEQTAPATLPREIEVKAIEDCRVEGRTQTNNTPDHSDCGSTCGAAAHNANPSNGKQYERGEGYRRVQSPMLCSRDQSRARKPRPLQKEQRGNASDPSA